MRVDYYIDIVKLLGGLTLDDDGLGASWKGTARSCTNGSRLFRRGGTMRMRYNNANECFT